MKTSISYSLIAAAMACGLANAQTTAYTDPVGYITSSIAGSGGAPSADSYISSSLVQPSTYAGASTNNPSGSATVNFSSGVPTTLDGTYVLEISSGAQAGWWSTVVSSSATSVTVTDALPSGLAIGTSVVVRKHNTLSTFLGANSAGLIPFDGENPSDEVQILNPASQVVTTCAYVSFAISGLPDGWFDLGLSASADNYIIEPGASIKIKRVGALALSLVSSGSVKVSNTQVDVYPGFNWIGTQLGAGGTFDYMNLASQLIPFDGASTNSDELQFLSAAQVVTPYASLDPSFGLGVVMGNLATSEAAGDTVFAQGTGAVLKRDATTPPGVITIPGTTVAP
jgi:hypothetical protein